MIILALLIGGTAMAATMPSAVAPQIKKPVSSESYDDASFEETVSYAINNLTDPIPTEKRLMELKSVYYDLVEKRISHEYYPLAKDTADYLIYVMKAAEGFQEYDEHIGARHIDMDMYFESQNRPNWMGMQRNWMNISALYPGATPSPIIKDDRIPGGLSSPSVL